MSLRDDILTAADLPIERVETPEWPAVDGKLYVRTLTAAELEEFTDTTAKDPRNGRARFAALVLCDESHYRMFGDDDAAELAGKNFETLERIWRVGGRLNGIVKDDAAKNSETTQ